MKSEDVHLHQYVEVKGWGDNLFQVKDLNGGRHPRLQGVRRPQMYLTPPVNLIREAPLERIEDLIFIER